MCTWTKSHIHTTYSLTNNYGLQDYGLQDYTLQYYSLQVYCLQVYGLQDYGLQVYVYDRNAITAGYSDKSNAHKLILYSCIEFPLHRLSTRCTWFRSLWVQDWICNQCKQQRKDGTDIVRNQPVQTLTSANKNLLMILTANTQWKLNTTAWPRCKSRNWSKTSFIGH